MKGKKICIVGAGSIGLYYGGRLAAAGHDVHFLMRSGHEEARREGIRIYSEDGDVHLPSPQVALASEQIGSSDLVIVSLKATANAALADIVPPLLGPETAILTLQNGLGNEEHLAGLFGAERVMGGLCFICLTRRTPASVDHIGAGKLTIGEFGRAPLPRTRAVVEAFHEARVNSAVVENLANERWRKLVWNVPFNGLSVARGGVPTDALLANREIETEVRGLMREVVATARALGHPIEDDYVDYQIERTRPMGPYRPSTLVDWQGGSPLEIEPIWGEPLRQAAAAGVDTPRLAALYEELKRLNPGA